MRRADLFALRLLGHPNERSRAMNVAGKKRAGQVPAVKKVAEPKATYPTRLSFNPAEAGEAVAAETTDPIQTADAAPAAPIRLLSKKEVLVIANVSFPTIWSRMRRGEFPRARVSCWRQSSSSC